MDTKNEDNEVVIKQSKKFDFISFPPIRQGASFQEDVVLLGKTVMENIGKYCNILNPDAKILNFGAFYVLYVKISSDSGNKEFSLKINPYGLLEYSVFYLNSMGIADPSKRIIKSEPIPINTTKLNNEFGNIIESLK